MITSPQQEAVDAAITSRRSIRAFLDKPVERADVERILDVAARAPSEVWTDGLAGLMEMDLRHAVQHIAVPALVLVGEQDRMTPPASSVALAGELPQGRLEVIERAGHFPMMEAHEEFNRRLASFADGVLRPRRSRRKTA